MTGWSSSLLVTLNPLSRIGMNVDCSFPFYLYSIWDGTSLYQDRSSLKPLWKCSHRHVQMYDLEEILNYGPGPVTPEQ